MTIRLATVDDLPALIEIERAADAIFARVGITLPPHPEPGVVDSLLPYQAERRAWVFATDDDAPVAYASADVVDGNGYLAEVSVHPDHARRGIGAALIEHAHAWARDAGLPAMTLTTFAIVPWNGPYYQRLGYRMLLSSEITPGLVEIRRAEHRRGLDRWVRVCMICPLDDDG